METSVIRIGEISPLRQNFINLCQMVEGLFSVWQNVYNLGSFSMLKMTEF